MSSSPNKLNVHALVWQGNQLSALDQRQLPKQVHDYIFTTGQGAIFNPTNQSVSELKNDD
ncbi:MAG: hypothetical protein KAJ63_14935 [Methyloprofundus sp.]|nr:hypothetical protein [Methyloprofundus sp.]